MQTAITRRSALTRLTGTAAAAAAAATLSQQLTAAESAAGPLKGHINHSVCKWCYGKLSLEEMCKLAKEIGLGSVELLAVSDFALLKKYDLKCAMVSGCPGGIGDGLNRIENHAKIAEFMEQTVPQVAEAGHPNIICFSGNRKGMSNEQGLENCAIGIKKFISVAEKNKVTICMELLNSKVNHKDYMCDYSAWGVELCKRVGSENFKLLYDIYHMQIMEGDIIATIKQNGKYFGHYHTGGVPGRNEIDETQEIYYPAVMKAIVATGYKGFVGHEWLPKHLEPVASLKQGVSICDV
jgi:hydroxypyruvate isomerase